MSRTYRMHEFAELAGVTIKALRHYDRLGLLKPKRTNGGYRVYAGSDLERLEEIIALKFLGLPLKQIKIVLDRPALELTTTLRLQRKALEEKQHLLSRAILAIRMAEETIEAGKAAKPAVLKRIIEVIDVQNDVEMMKKYYSSEAAWEKRRRLYEEGPSQEWKKLYRDVNAALDQDPAGAAAQRLADRWLKLSLKAYGGDPDNQMDSITAWLDRENWPASMKRRIAEFNLEEVFKFLEQVVLCARKKYFSESAWKKMVEIRRDPGRFSVVWQSQVDLFRAASGLDETPNSERARAVAVRWIGHLDTASGGDPEVRTGLMKVWADRRNWTATLRWLEEGLAMTTGEQFDRAADFIDEAISSTSQPGH